MIYIRTIDTENIDNQKILEVYEITKGTEFEGLIYKCYTPHNDFTEAIVFDCDIIAQAETIEELCDEFVFDSDVSNYIIDKKQIEHIKATILKIYKENDESDYVKAMHPKLYGAIWTYKGLIYVAKLNEDGELVLI